MMIAYIISFGLGCIAGALVMRVLDLALFVEAKHDKKTFFDIATSKESMRWFIAIIIALTFLSAIIAELLDKSYQVNLALYGLMTGSILFDQILVES